MGSCTSRELENKEKEGINVKNFEFPAFVKYCEYGQYLAFQKFLQHLWKGVEIGNKETDKWVRKGVPDVLTVKVVRSFLMVDLEKALGIYKDIQSNFPEADFVMENSGQYLKTIQESKYFLTERGRCAAKRIVFFLNFILNTSDLVFMPNLVHLFLWYFDEAEVFYILINFVKKDAEFLVSESSCNSTQPISYKQYFVKQRQVSVISRILSQWLLGSEKTSEVLVDAIREMIETLCLNFVSPLYYPFILQNFILDKFDAVIKVIISLFGCIHFEYMNSCEEIKTQMIEKFNYFGFIERYEKVNLENILQSSSYQV